MAFKKIHVLLSKEAYNDLIKLDLKLFGTTDKPPYEEYLKKEEEHPTMALFG